MVFFFENFSKKSILKKSAEDKKSPEGEELKICDKYRYLVGWSKYRKLVGGLKMKIMAPTYPDHMVMCF